LRAVSGAAPARATALRRQAPRPTRRGRWRCGGPGERSSRCSRLQGVTPGLHCVRTRAAAAATMPVAALVATNASRPFQRSATESGRCSSLL